MSTEEKHRASLLLSYEALRQILHLRDDLKVVDVRANCLEGTVDIILSGESLPIARRSSTFLRKPWRELIDWELG